MPPRSSPSAFCDAALQPEPDRRVDRAPAAAVDARDHAVAEAQRRAAAARRGGRRRCARARSASRPRCRRSRRRSGPSSAAARRRRRCSRAAAGGRCGGAPPRPPRGRAAAARASTRRAPRPARPREALNVIVPSSVPKSSVVTFTGTRTVAVAEQRAEPADRDLLDARGAVRAPVVGQERDPRVLLLAAAVQQRVHRLVVARAPRGHERAARRAAARPCPAAGAPARTRPRRARRGSRRSRTGRSATARADAAGGRAWAGRGTANRPGARTRAIRTGNGVDVGGPPVLVLAGRADRLPS